MLVVFDTLRFDKRLILTIFCQEELKTYDMAYETFTGLQGRVH